MGDFVFFALLIMIVGLAILLVPVLLLRIDRRVGELHDRQRELSRQVAHQLKAVYDMAVEQRQDLRHLQSILRTGGMAARETATPVTQPLAGTEPLTQLVPETQEEQAVEVIVAEPSRPLAAPPTPPAPTRCS